MSRGFAGAASGFVMSLLLTMSTISLTFWSAASRQNSFFASAVQSSGFAYAPPIFLIALAAVIGDSQQPFDCSSAAYGGLPAMVVPAGFTAGGLPVGLELMGRPFAEPALIAIAAGYEAHTSHRALPPTTPPLDR